MTEDSPVRSSNALQLYRDMRGQISRGELPVGTKLPSVRKLAQTAGVSVNTAQRTMAKLQARGLIESSPGRRSVVKARVTRMVKSKVPKGAHLAVIHRVDPEKHEQPLSSTWWGGINDAIVSVLHRYDMQAVTVTYMGDTKDVRGGIERQFDNMAGKLAGVICFPGLDIGQLSGVFAERRLPFVTVNRPMPEWSHNFVAADYVGAGQRIGLYLTRMGFERLFLLGDHPSISPSWNELTAGILQSYVFAGASLDHVRFLQSPAECSEMNGHSCTCEALNQYGKPDAIVAAGDFLAIGANRALHESGIHVPDEVSVIGGMGGPMSKMTSPPLSTVAQPLGRIGTEVAEMMVEMLLTSIDRLPGRILPTPVVLRGTTKLTESFRNEIAAANGGDNWWQLKTDVSTAT